MLLSACSLTCILIRFQIFISFFFKQHARKKKAQLNRGQKKGKGSGKLQGHNCVETIEVSAVSKNPYTGNVDGNESGSELEDMAPDVRSAEQELADIMEQIESEVPVDDSGQEAQDEIVVTSLRDKAIKEMSKQGVFISSEERKMALGLFPKVRCNHGNLQCFICAYVLITIMLQVAGLARRIHDSSSTLGTEFTRLVNADNELQNATRHTLPRRMPVRWNTDFACLEGHQYFKKVVKTMTEVSANKLKAFKLTDDQWELLEQLVDILAVRMRIFITV